MGKSLSEIENKKSLLKRANTCTKKINNSGVTMVSDVFALR